MIHRSTSIRTRIFFSYVVLIAIIGVFIALAGIARTVRVGIEEDRAAVLELRTSWGATRTLLGDMIINWNNGEAYEEFRAQRARFAQQLATLDEEIGSNRLYRDQFTGLLDGLSAVWATADSHLDRVTAIVDDPGFEMIESMVARQPGLQRLNHLWAELVDDPDVASRRSAHLIQRLITEIEFFPIYGDTLERLLAELAQQSEQLQQEIVRAESIGRVVFFVTFLAACLFLASRFSISLSRPIIDVTRRVNSFSGLAGQTVLNGHGGEYDPEIRDEVSLLSGTIDRMIAHYTELADRAGQLARGEVSGDAPQFPREGVVGRSLDEIAGYLHELASTSAWIRNGEYGSRIRERSDNDVITRNFNIMSGVIDEKITTLKNMFEAVDEAVLVVDSERTVLEANSQLYRLLGVESGSPQAKDLIRTSVVPRLFGARQDKSGPTDDGGHYLTLESADHQEIPVKIAVRVLPETDRMDQHWMFIITNESWRARARREQERLQAQATVAELRALRAQINPHFFFNTLNTISHLIETDTDTAGETVQHMADLFRYTLAATKFDQVPFGDELRHVQTYLRIEQLRHGDTLRITYEVDDRVLGRPVPPMLIQPLVENAVRYGGNEFGIVDLTIAAELKLNDLVVEIRDRGSEVVDPESLFHADGTGIKNVNHRVRTLFGRPITVRQNEPSGLIVTLNIPGGAA